MCALGLAWHGVYPASERGGAPARRQHPTLPAPLSPLQVTENQRIALVEFIAHLMQEDWEAVASDLVNLGEGRLGGPGGACVWAPGGPACGRHPALPRAYFAYHLGLGVRLCVLRMLARMLARKSRLLPWVAHCSQRGCMVRQ